MVSPYQYHLLYRESIVCSGFVGSIDEGFSRSMILAGDLLSYYPSICFAIYAIDRIPRPNRVTGELLYLYGMAHDPEGELIVRQLFDFQAECC